MRSKRGNGRETMFSILDKAERDQGFGKQRTK